MNTIRMGIFPNPDAGAAAIERLLAAGVDREAISVVCPQGEDVAVPGVNEQDAAGENTTDAAVKGGAIGALSTFLVAAVALPATAGVGVLVAGPLLGATAAGAIGGGFVGAMLTRGFEPAIADFYDQAVRRGKVLVSVESDDPQVLAKVERELEAAGSEPLELASENP